MSWRRESLLMKRTREPGVTVSSFGLTIPAFEMAIVGPTGGGGGDDGVEPPQAAIVTLHTRNALRIASGSRELRLALLEKRGRAFLLVV